MHHLDIKIEISASCDVRQQCKPKRISSTLGDAIGEGGFLIFGCSADLLLLKVAHQELSVERFKINATDDIQGVDDIS